MFHACGIADGVHWVSDGHSGGGYGEYCHTVSPRDPQPFRLTTTWLR